MDLNIVEPFAIGDKVKTVKSRYCIDTGQDEEWIGSGVIVKIVKNQWKPYLVDDGCCGGWFSKRELRRVERDR